MAWKQLLQSSYKPLSPAAKITNIPSLDSCWFPETGASRKRPPLDTITWKRSHSFWRPSLCSPGHTGAGLTRAHTLSPSTSPHHM